MAEILEFLPVSLLVLAAALAVTAFAAAFQSTIGLGFAIVSVPLLSLLDPVLAPAPQVIMALPMVLWVAWRERHAIELKGVGWVIAGRLPGSAAGAGLLAIADQQNLDLMIACLVIAAAVIIGWGVHVRRRVGTEVGAGFAAGISGVVASMDGPPLGLLYAGAEGPTLRANLAAIFAVGILATGAGRFAAGGFELVHVHIAILLLPALLVGTWASKFLIYRVDRVHLKRAVLVVCVVAAVGLLSRALSV